ncbi:unnamed protein product [Blepharisma stoltei]|uniref:COMM domain-containing protein 5 n=1 Tax=Blepharisma stoltei TaxID=1481888 RepID=A0AAU9JMT0_9CILI|nr:unnamed protein product [Blepharisma stoltei]
MESLKTLSADNLSALFGLSSKYLLQDFTVLKQIPFSQRENFTICIEYLRKKCGKHSSEYLHQIEEENWPSALKDVVIRNLTEIDTEFRRRQEKERLVDINWRIDVSLSTNSFSKVLRPEVQVKMTNGEKEISFHMTVAQFQELRRQTAGILKDMFTLDQFAFIRNLK